MTSSTEARYSRSWCFREEVFLQRLLEGEFCVDDTRRFAFINPALPPGSPMPGEGRSSERLACKPRMKCGGKRVWEMRVGGWELGVGGGEGREGETGV